MIADGCDMWEDTNLPQQIVLFKEHYIDHMAANPRISQQIKRAVKRCNHVGLDSGNNRDEKRDPCMQ